MVRIITVVITGLLAFPALARAEEETLGDKASDAGHAIKDAAVATGETLERAGEKVVDRTKELFSDDEANKVPVKLDEHKIDMPASIAAGKTRFVVTNAGKEKHNFEVEGEGMEKKFLIALGPGDTKNLDIDLKPGEYTVYCPAEGHAGKGMTTKLTVK